MKRFYCNNCGNEVHFESTECVTCHQILGYEPVSATMLATTRGEAWHGSDGAEYNVCANMSAIGCNWLVPAGGPDTLCIACRHNHTIPDLSQPQNQERWRRLEAAKRRLFYSLLRWNLPLPMRQVDGDGGLAFDFLADTVNPDGSVTPVLTGHADGLITINIAEGDDAERERRRTDMGEPYRTLVGHFRHEIGHYYWDRLVRDGGPLDAFRALFGDERIDYGEALQRHYAEGAPFDWADNYISTYAAAHPWEDFAETFAHYLHMVDALETAHAYGLLVQPGYGSEPGEVMENPYNITTIDALIAAFVPITVAMNAINRSMGQPDLYPFVLSRPVEEKLGFVHRLIHQWDAAAAETLSLDPAMLDAARAPRRRWFL
ncbi:zinc-binding metallopeptidase family protein [Acuticoccus mangrovi]|uniref:Zinc-binding peptidase n=1 Tax=Acuticoccus mangrovi TaxID=2796142 RepID=A0A934MHE7_9HYPH|nr:putative zinc-binding metallopeptidase [Acuticoccus mangrovi]MBJ3776875.1 putative zinc-binding peptidase [Acuticoccus mangrovi]